MRAAYITPIFTPFKGHHFTAKEYKESKIGVSKSFGVQATLQDISQSADRTVFRDDKMVWRSTVSSPSWVWGEAPAEIEFDAF